MSESEAPKCNEQFELTDDGLIRILSRFKVYCPHRESGCEWKGELGDLQSHLNEDPESNKLLLGCLFQEIRCGLCQAHSCERRLMNDHVSAQCPNREMECEYHYAGCDVKMPQHQLESHSKEAVSLHLSLVTNFVRGNLSQKDNEIQTLKEELSQQRKQIQEQMQALNEKHTELKEQHTELKEWHAELKQQITEQKQQYTELKEQHAELKQQNTEQKQQYTELKQQHTDLQRHTNGHWILLSSIFVIIFGRMAYVYLYQTDHELLVNLNKLNISMKEVNVTLSSRLESLGFHQEQFINSCMNASNLTDLYGKILELNSSIQQMELKQDSKTGDVQQQFSKLLEKTEAKGKSRDQQVQNEIQALSEALERNITDLRRLKSACKIATMQVSNLSDKVQELNNSIQQVEMKQDSVILEKQVVASSDESRHEYNSSSWSANELQQYERLKNPEKQLIATNNEQRYEHNSPANELQLFRNENLDQQDLVDFPVLPVYLNMTDVKEHNASKSHWLSKPFYTHEGGYKMRLVVYPNGKYSGAGTHISVATYLMSGKYDDKLDWPANVTLIITLLNRDSEDKDPIVRLFDYPTSNFGLPILDRIWNSSMAKIGVIHSHFASHSTVVHSYVKHNSLYFHIDWVRREAKAKQSNNIRILNDPIQWVTDKITHFLKGLKYFGGDSDGIIIYCCIHTCYLSDSLFSPDLTVDSL